MYKKSKRLLILSAFFIGALGISKLSYAGDRAGNGGSDDESRIASQQAILQSTALKIKKFFITNGPTLQKEFPEFSVRDLIEKIEKSEIRIVDTEELVDKHGKSRTCLNFPDLNVIECKYSDIKNLESNPQTLFVLTMHEYLGLLGVEETMPSQINFIDGYSISKRLAGYVTKVNDYDLVLDSNESSCAQTEKFKDLVAAGENLQLVINVPGGLTVTKGMFGGFCFRNCFSGGPTVGLYTRHQQTIQGKTELPKGSKIPVISAAYSDVSNRIVMRLDSDSFGTLEATIPMDSPISQIEKFSGGNFKIVCE